jgi:hypothetical protein
MYNILPVNKREWERALLLPFQSVIVLVFPIFSIVASLNPPGPGYGSGEAAVAEIFVPGCFLCCIVLLVSGLVQLFRANFGKADKAYLRDYAYINFGFVALGIMISVHLLRSYVFIK